MAVRTVPAIERAAAAQNRGDAAKPKMVHEAATHTNGAMA